ncbi:TIGR03086 family metal-binding protein [Streptomyces solisilvae]|uniref:TIGR03086 family metal-binding protein n=1 Tax=Streptomyces malaysiensis TaxID=92644 RepID=UPI0036774512
MWPPDRPVDGRRKATVRSPCTDWNVRQMVDHLLAGQHTSAVVMGARRPLPALGPAPGALKKAFRTSAAALVAAFDEPGALERTVRAPIGEVPGAVALRLQTIEHLVHGWDLARAIGQKALFDEATVEREIEFARGRPHGTDAVRTGHSVRAVRAAPDDAPRSTGWPRCSDATSPSDPYTVHRGTPRPQPSRGTRTTMKKTKLKITIAGAALVAAVATGTALAANGSSTGSGSTSGSTSGAERTRTEHAEQKTPSVIKADGPNVFPHSLDFDARSNTFFAGSLKHGTVSAVRPDGKVRTFIDDPELVSAQAVLVDRERDRILVSNVDYGTADRSRKDAPFRVAGVGSYDLKSGKQDWCVDLTALTLDGKQHLISDVTVAPDGTAYAVDELTPTVFRIDRTGHASVFLRNDLLKGTLEIPDLLNGVGMSAVEWVEGNQLIIAMADGSLVRVPVKHPEKAQEVKLSAPLGSPTAGMRLLKDGSIAAVSSGLLTGKPAPIQRVEPRDGWKKATVKVTDTVEDPVTSDVTAGPDGTTYALSGGLADLFAGKPHDGFSLTPVKTD